MCSCPSDPPEGTEFTNPTNLYFYGDVLTVSCRDSSASTLWICLSNNNWSKHELVCTTDSSKQTLVMISALLGVLLPVFIITCALFIIYRHRTGSAKLNTNNSSVRMTGGEVHFEDGGISNPSLENVSADTNYNGAENLPKKDALNEEDLDLNVGGPLASNDTYLGTLDNVPLHPPTYSEA
ncbi:uncharacterized protein LOC100892810 [Strongylocentrotus purpuratus]|uniref:Sushi domain-containing protein n=1 Tax=Strongylocentrotus purpuratus TaxID=7668 RepID=A0A7M7LL86_STRPU|nr:uncharacterized protein LOC100892810 [Strongylocentrotus purpuratus]|eukprot:XP_003725546.1 PREDICTED: uncharacterized protein LOC100892810 [Strongylocentrotus purpuratus]